MSHEIAILAIPGVQLLDVAGPMDVFAEANRVLKRAFYTLKVISLTGSDVATSSGVRLTADLALTDIVDYTPDTFLVAGAPHISCFAPAPGVLNALTGLCDRSSRFGSVCSGALLLAQTGQLRGKRVTTHWASAEALARLHSDIAVEADALFIVDGKVCTAAGVTSGLDLALRLVEDDLGRDTAEDVASQLVMFFRRPVNQTHFVRSNQISLQGRSSLQDLQRWTIANIKSVTGVSAMADYINLSPRHLSRIFRQETGMTPAQWLERERVAFARQLIESDMLPVKKLAAACGFSSPDVMRRVFSRVTGITPAAWRKMIKIGRHNTACPDTSAKQHR